MRLTADPQKKYCENCKHCGQHPLPHLCICLCAESEHHNEIFALPKYMIACESYVEEVSE